MYSLIYIVRFESRDLLEAFATEYGKEFWSQFPGFVSWKTLWPDVGHRSELLSGFIVSSKELVSIVEFQERSQIVDILANKGLISGMTKLMKDFGLSAVPIVHIVKTEHETKA